MDQGTDAASMLRGDDVPLRLGYVGVKMRSQQDIVNKKPVKDSLKDEKDWFENHRVYSNLEWHPQHCCVLLTFPDVKTPFSWVKIIVLTVFTDLREVSSLMRCSCDVAKLFQVSSLLDLWARQFWSTSLRRSFSNIFEDFSPRSRRIGVRIDSWQLPNENASEEFLWSFPKWSSYKFTISLLAVTPSLLYLILIPMILAGD